MEAKLQRYHNEGLTQSSIASLAKVSVPQVCRYLSRETIQPMVESNQKYRRYDIPSTRAAILGLTKNDKPIIKKKHAFYNFKGGTGKTSICYQVSSHLAFMGYRVLVIDADPQAHLSVSFGFSDDSHLTLYDIILGHQSLDNVIKNIFEGLDCIPSNLSLTRLEAELSQMTRREERLYLELQDLEKQYDFIFIDTNPTISILNRNIINYVDMLDIVCETQPYSLNGLKLLMEDLSRFCTQMGIHPKAINVIPNKYEDRTANSAEAMTVLKTYYANFLKPDFAIRRSEDIITSSKLGKPLALFTKKNSIALKDIIEISHHIEEISR